MDRKSFASIEEKIHPNVQNNIFDFKDIKLNSLENDQLVEEILGFFDDKIRKEISGTGEWEWLQKNKQNNFINALFERKSQVVSQFLTNMFRNEATYGYLSPSYSDAIMTPETVKSNILCNIDSCFEFSDINKIEDLVSIHGNPYGLKINEYCVLPDTPRHYYYSYKISRLLGTEKDPTLIEIGGGYGGLCLQNWKRYNGKCTIVNIDLFPALVVVCFYLIKNDIPVNLVTEKKCEIKKNMINLIVAEDLKAFANLLPVSHLIFNSHSLCEMHEDTISEYFSFINSHGAKFVYHDNSNFLLFPNSERHIELVADKFPIDVQKYRLIIKHLSPFTGGNGRYREYIYEKF